MSKRRKYQQKSTFDCWNLQKKSSHLESISIALKLKIRRVSNTLTTPFLLFNVLFLFSWNKPPFTFVQIKWCEFKLVLTLTLEIRISNTGLQSFQRWEMIIGAVFKLTTSFCLSPNWRSDPRPDKTKRCLSFVPTLFKSSLDVLQY